MKHITSIVSLCLCLGTVDVKASIKSTHYHTSPHIVIVRGHSSYRLDSSYDELSIVFFNKSSSDLIIRLNGSMLYSIAPGKVSMFWRNGKLWEMGYST